MTKYSGHKLQKFMTPDDMMNYCVLHCEKPPMKGGHHHRRNWVYSESAGKFVRRNKMAEEKEHD